MQHVDSLKGKITIGRSGFMNEPDYYPPIIKANFKLDSEPMPTIQSPAKVYEANSHKVPYDPYPLSFNKHSISVDHSNKNWDSLWPSNS